VKGIPNRFSEAELTWVKSHCEMPRREAHANFVTKFNRGDVTFGAFTGLCKRKGWLTGRNGKFEKDNVPWNEGKTMPFNANSAATQFKKGGLPHNTKWVGHERISKDGYVEISIDEVNPHTGFKRRYVLKHRYLWEMAHGPVPKDMCLKCLDANKTNMALSNWELVPREMLPRLNNRWGRDYDHAPSEVKPALMMVAKIQSKMRSRIKS
jgi:HNH endonuclease